MRQSAGFLVVLGLFLAAPAASEIYTYTDSTGVVSYTDDLDRVPEAYKEQVKVIPSGNLLEHPRVTVAETVRSSRLGHLRRLNGVTMVTNRSSLSSSNR